MTVSSVVRLFFDSISIPDRPDAEAGASGLGDPGYVAPDWSSGQLATEDTATKGESVERFGSRFTLDYISAGPHAHGFGMTDGGNPYSFRVRGRSLVVEIYREGAETVPGLEDVIASVRRSVIEIDLSDERSISAVVRDAVSDHELAL